MVKVIVMNGDTLTIRDDSLVAFCQFPDGCAPCVGLNKMLRSDCLMTDEGNDFQECTYLAWISREAYQAWIARGSSTKDGAMEPQMAERLKRFNKRDNTGPLSGGLPLHHYCE